MKLGILKRNTNAEQLAPIAGGESIKDELAAAERDLAAADAAWRQVLDQIAKLMPLRHETASRRRQAQMRIDRLTQEEKQLRAELGIDPVLASRIARAQARFDKAEVELRTISARRMEILTRVGSALRAEGGMPTQSRVSATEWNEGRRDRMRSELYAIEGKLPALEQEWTVASALLNDLERQKGLPFVSPTEGLEAQVQARQERATVVTRILRRLGEDMGGREA